MRRLTLIALIALVGAACGDDAGDTTTMPEAMAPEAEPTTTTTPTTTEPEPTPATTQPEALEVRLLTVSDTILGTILTDDAGMTLYLFEPDAQGQSTCYGACAFLWPPLTDGVAAGSGVDPALLGSVERDDGSVQATYNGWPLYYYGPDDEPGRVRGQGIVDDWWVISPEGDAIQ